MTANDHITLISNNVTPAYVVPPINNVDYTKPPVIRLLQTTAFPRIAAETITSEHYEIYLQKYKEQYGKVNSTWLNNNFKFANIMHYMKIIAWSG